MFVHRPSFEPSDGPYSYYIMEEFYARSAMSRVLVAFSPHGSATSRKSSLGRCNDVTEAVHLVFHSSLERSCFQRHPVPVRVPRRQSQSRYIVTKQDHHFFTRNTRNMPERISMPYAPYSRKRQTKQTVQQHVRYWSPLPQVSEGREDGGAITRVVKTATKRYCCCRLDRDGYR